MIKVQSLLGFVRKEFRQSLRNPVMKRLIFLAPLLQLTVFGFALNNETRNIRMAIFSQPSDVLMRKFNDKAYATGWFERVNVKENDPFKAIQEGDIEVAVVVKEKKLEEATVLNPQSIQILINSVNSLRAQVIENYVQQIFNSTLESESTALKKSLQIQTETRILYNPKMETSFFLIPGLIGIIICLITVLLTSMSVTRERELGTLEMILSAPIQKWEIIIGKAIPSTILALINSLLTCSVGAIVFGIPFTGSWFWLALVIFIFIVSTVAMGIAISTVSVTQQQAMMGSFLFLFPALLLSGLMFPVENMPPLMRIFADINPMTHFNYLMRNIILKGGDTEYILTHTGIILIIGLVALVLSFKNFKTTLN